MRSDTETLLVLAVLFHHQEALLNSWQKAENSQEGELIWVWDEAVLHLVLTSSSVPASAADVSSEGGLGVFWLLGFVSTVEEENLEL